MMTTVTTGPAAAAARRGAAVLDVLSPGGWADAIDLARLDLRDERCCVLGQLWGYEVGLARVLRQAPCRLRPPASVAASPSWPAWYGFAADGAGEAAGEALQEAWVAEITARRRGG